MPQEQFARPPRTAAWLVNLFVPYEQAGAVTGDLLEEFSDIASKSGVVGAKRWYWRQCIRTIIHFFGAGLRGAPWGTAGAVLGGLLFIFFALPQLISSLVWRPLLIYPVIFNGKQIYRIVPYMVPWVVAVVQIATAIALLIIGCAVAIVARGREISATVMLFAINTALFVIRVVWMARETYGLRFLSPSRLIATFAGTTMIVAGGILVRMYRNTKARRPSAA